MRSACVDSRAKKLEFPEPKLWPQLLLAQTLRGNDIYELQCFSQTQKHENHSKLFTDEFSNRPPQPQNILHRKLKPIWQINLNPSADFIIIWNKRWHSLEAKCDSWHRSECFPPIMRHFNAECDLACEYLTAVHASLICIPLSFSSLLPLSSILYQISGIFPLGVESQKDRPRFLKMFYSFINETLVRRVARVDSVHLRLTLWPLLCQSDLPYWSWDLFLPCLPPPGATGNRLLWHSGLCSHGEAHYCGHMAG